MLAIPLSTIQACWRDSELQDQSTQRPEPSADAPVPAAASELLLASG
jgi:hypothetical protein